MFFTWCFFVPIFLKKMCFLPWSRVVCVNFALYNNDNERVKHDSGEHVFHNEANVLTAFPQQPSSLKFLVGHAMVHHSYDGVPCFLHRTIDKHEVGGSFSTGRSGLGHYMSLFFFYLCGRNLFFEKLKQTYYIHIHIQMICCAGIYVWGILGTSWWPWFWSEMTCMLEGFNSPI